MRNVANNENNTRYLNSMFSAVCVLKIRNSRVFLFLFLSQGLCVCFRNNVGDFLIQLFSLLILQPSNIFSSSHYLLWDCSRESQQCRVEEDITVESLNSIFISSGANEPSHRRRRVLLKLNLIIIPPPPHHSIPHWNVLHFLSPFPPPFQLTKHSNTFHEKLHNKNERIESTFSFIQHKKKTWIHESDIVSRLNLFDHITTYTTVDECKWGERRRGNESLKKWGETLSSSTLLSCLFVACGGETQSRAKYEVSDDDEGEKNYSSHIFMIFSVSSTPRIESCYFRFRHPLLFHNYHACKVQLRVKVLIVDDNRQTSHQDGRFRFNEHMMCRVYEK